MPDVLYIDDDPTAFLSVASDDQKARIETIEFDKEVGADQLASAAGKFVWLFDFFLVDPALGAQDENGLSLLQKLRAAAPARPISVMVSSDIEKALGEPLGRLERRHVVAQRQGVEWIGDKSQAKASETLRQILVLADGAATIASKLALTKTDDGTAATYELEALCFDVLGVDSNAPWARSVLRQVDRARPPREVPIASSAATARVITAWLMSHVLPYPSFLLSDSQAALRLKLMPTSLSAIAGALGKGTESPERQKLGAALYAGPLDDFLGRRWWRAAVDDLAWQLSQNAGGYEAAIASLAGENRAEVLKEEEPVVLSDADLVEGTEVAEARDCVRVTDEDFPANVDPAWVLIASARENRDLASKVIFEDRELLAE